MKIQYRNVSHTLSFHNTATDSGKTVGDTAKIV